jgi:Protein of unknown function (DUF1236)
MKRTKILTAVSAAALLGISSFALAQGTSGGGTGGAGAPAGNTMQRQQETPPTGTSTQNSPSMSKDSMSKDDMKSNRAQSKEMDKDSSKSQAQDKGMSKDAPKAAQSPTDSKSQMSQDKDGAKSGSTVGAASSGAVNLTTEQRTTIRKEVLTSNAPRATNINFSVNVGTVVPSSVRVVEVPPTIIKIHPQWKGYRYFVYNDEIIIVEPRTLKIVAVLDV